MRKLLLSKATFLTGIGISSAVVSKYALEHYQKHGLVLAAQMNETEEKDHETLKLKSVQVFFRHGARTPLSHLPNIEEVNYDKTYIHARVPYTEVPYEVYNLENGGPRPPAYLDEKYKKVTFKGGVFAGALTALGKDQTYNLGRQLRSKYFNLLGLNQKYDPSQVCVRSTNINRTIESLQGVLGGLFGKDAFTDPVRIAVVPLHREYLFPQTRYCKPFSALYQKTLTKEDDLGNIRELTGKINDIIGHEGYLNMMAWRDTLVARKAHGLPIPNFMLQLENEIEQAATDIVCAHSSGIEGDRAETLKYTTGPLLDMVVQNIHNTSSDNNSNPKMYLYSCHDTTVVPLQVALNIFDNKWPKYCANITVELWGKNGGENSVKILYCGKEVVPEGMKSAEMSVADFEKLVKPYRMPLTDWCSVCQLREPESNEAYERHPLKIDETIAPKSM